MKKTCLLLFSTLFLLNVNVSPDFVNNDVHRRFANSNTPVSESTVYDILGTGVDSNNHLFCKLNGVPNNEVVHSDLDPRFVDGNVGNAYKSFPWRTSYFDFNDPANGINRTGTKINADDDYFCINRGVNNYSYYTLQHFNSNFYFDEKLDRVQMYVPAFYSFDDLKTDLSSIVSYINFPLLSFNGEDYLEASFDNGELKVVGNKNTKILNVDSYYWLVEFDNPHQINTIDWFSADRYTTSYANIKNYSMFNDNIYGKFIPSKTISGKVEHLPFEIYDFEFDNDAQIRIVPNSFSALDKVNKNHFLSLVPYGESLCKGDQNWMAVDSKGQTYIDKINVHVTNESSYYDKDGVFHQSDVISSYDKEFSATQNVGGPSGKFLYDYFPSFELKSGDAGVITLNSFTTYHKNLSDQSVDLENPMTFDLSNVKRFHYTYDCRPVINIAWVQPTVHRFFHYKNDLGGKFKSFLASFLNTDEEKRIKPDYCEHDYGFSFYFDKDKKEPIKNIKKFKFSTRVGLEPVKIHECIINKDYGWDYFSLKNKPNPTADDVLMAQVAIMNKEAGIPNYYNADGFAFFNYEFLVKHLGVTPEDVLIDETKTASGQHQDYYLNFTTPYDEYGANRTAVSPIAVWFESGSQTNVLSQAVFNDLGLHVVNGQVFDKDNNLRLDYNVKDFEYKDPETGSIVTSPEIVDKDGNILDSDTSEPPIDTGSTEDNPWNDLWDKINNAVNENPVMKVIKTVLIVIASLLGLGLLFKFLQIVPIHKWIWNIVSWPFKKLAKLLKKNNKK